VTIPEFQLAALYHSAVAATYALASLACRHLEQPAIAFSKKLEQRSWQMIALAFGLPEKPLSLKTTVSKLPEIRFTLYLAWESRFAKKSRLRPSLLSEAT